MQCKGKYAMRISQCNPPNFISGLSEPKVVSLCLRGVCGFLLHRFLKSFPNLSKLLVFTASSFCGVSNTSVHSRDLMRHNCSKQELLYFLKRKLSHIFSDCSHPYWHPKSSCALLWPKNHRLNPAHVN